MQEGTYMITQDFIHLYWLNQMLQDKGRIKLMFLFSFVKIGRMAFFVWNKIFFVFISVNETRTEPKC